ncbi:dymeclin [Brevipalpus obovatus]|uniref:dymeclin n=1 Tax=Brevipalpus obovatus TaxID=246614 RepID=UPI003D9E66D9
MGVTISSLNNLKNNEHLIKFSSNQHIPPEDPFWDEMLSFTFTKSIRTLEESKILEEATTSLLAALLQNNPTSCNLGSLVKVLAKKSESLKDQTKSEESLNIFTWQTFNSIFIARCCSKYLIQTLTEENVLKHFVAKSVTDGKESVESGPQIIDILIQNLVTLIVDIPVKDIYYSLHCECINLLLVLLSVQMYSVKPASKSVIYKSIMQKSAIHALLLTKSLISNFVRQDLAPRTDGGSFILGIASGLLSALTLGYSRPVNEDDRLPVLARLSIILLLVLTNHCTTGSNPYREALFNCCDLKVDSVGKGGIVSAFKTDFTKLFSTLATTQEQDHSTLLLYMLLHKNPSFRAFLISRTSELDVLVVPILKILYNSKEKSSHHIYMALIILLILSEDQLFNESVHDITLKNVTWYIDRTLSEITLGGLIVLVLIRTIQYNISRTRDKFLHTNLLATLANMSNHFKELSPFVCEKIVNLFERVSKKLSKMMNTQINLNGGGDHNERLSDKDTDIASTVGPIDSMPDPSLYEELLRMILEIINSALSSQLLHNPNLVYTLLYKRQVFEPFQSHSSFQDIIMNIETLLTFFSNRIAQSEDNTSVQQIHEVIKNCSLQWPSNKMKKFPELKFRYVETDQPEEFFIPYIWSIVYKASGIYFHSQNILLFNPHRNLI